MTKQRSLLLALALAGALTACDSKRDRSTEQRNPTADPATTTAPADPSHAGTVRGTATPSGAGDQYGEGKGADRDPGEPAIPGGTDTAPTTTPPTTSAPSNADGGVAAPSDASAGTGATTAPAPRAR